MPIVRLGTPIPDSPPWAAHGAPPRIGCAVPRFRVGSVRTAGAASSTAPRLHRWEIPDSQDDSDGDVLPRLEVPDSQDDSNSDHDDALQLHFLLESNSFQFQALHGDGDLVLPDAPTLVDAPTVGVAAPAPAEDLAGQSVTPDPTLANSRRRKRSSSSASPLGSPVHISATAPLSKCY